MTVATRVGRRIKALRKRKGYTQKRLANELFISQSYLREIEHGTANPTVNLVAKITAFLEALPSVAPYDKITSEMDEALFLQ
ncbi:Transcriptional regulator, XRE family [uncultured Eubacteriales bacterium]|uniref:Transcriptional regulator, XRE family n=1 Tax=uncultured Eubacteriales bacterium TaxID=172733 RepID=A0A212K063_9FIRM|nr:Transcriptional regulator, XRE family [uncultured Eubacteriales bacterium]